MEWEIRARARSNLANERKMVRRQYLLNKYIPTLSREVVWCGVLPRPPAPAPARTALLLLGLTLRLHTEIRFILRHGRISSRPNFPANVIKWVLVFMCANYGDRGQRNGAVRLVNVSGVVK